METLLNNLPAVLWFAITGLLIIAELFLGSFYMLALALGTLAAGAFAYTGSPLSQQLGAAILLSGVASVIIWLNQRNTPPVDMDDPDIGQSVTIHSIEPLTVLYRGAEWQAQSNGNPLEVGQHRHIQAKHGNVLIID